MGDAAATASTVLNSAQQWLTRVGKNAKQTMAVAGEKLDRAADSFNNTVDQYAQQVCAIHACALQGAAGALVAICSAA